MTELQLFSNKNILKSLSDMGVKTPLVNQFFKKEQKTKYSSNTVYIGRDNDMDELVGIDFSTAKQIQLIGATGDGKGWIARGMMDRFYWGGGAVFVATDVKPEYYSSIRPNKKEYGSKGWYMENEVPRGLPIESYYPYFFTKMFNYSFKHSKPCQLSLNDLNAYDFMTIVRIDEKHKSSTDILYIWNDILEENGYVDLDVLNYKIDNDTAMDSRTKKRIKREIETVIKNGLIGDEYSETFDIVKDINEDKIPILNLYGHSDLGAYNHYPCVFVAVMVRKLYSAKTSGKINMKKKVLIICDEARRFIPRLGEPSSKREFLAALELSRSCRMSFLFMFQNPWKVDPAIISQCRLTFVGHNVEPPDLKQIIQMKIGRLSTTYPMEFINEVAELKSQMKRHSDQQRDWMLIDSGVQESTIFKPFAPLSYHLAEGET